MAQFEVPQFIDLESKIVGPLTLKQFAMVAAPAFVSFLLFFVLNTFLWVVLAVIFVSSGVSFAFIKVGGRPLYLVALLAVKFFWQPKLFLWKRPLVREVIEIPERRLAEEKRNALKEVIGSFSGVSKLWQDLTTTKNPIPKREKRLPRASTSDIEERFQVFRRMTGEKEVAKRVDYR